MFRTCIECGKEFEPVGKEKSCSQRCKRKRYERYQKQYQKQWHFDHPEYSKQYYQNNSDKIKSRSKQWFQNNIEYSKQYYQNNSDKIKSRSKQYQQDNKESILRYIKKYQNNRNKTDLKYNLIKRMGTRIYQSLKGNKNGRRWEVLVGYTVNDLIKRLKKTMPESYIWQDYLDAKLHIDHIIPISVFNFTKPEHIDFKRCWALNNLQLLPAKENRKKYNKLE